MLSCPVSTCVVKNKIFFFFCHNVLTLASLCDCSILFYYEICYNSVNSKKYGNVQSTGVKTAKVNVDFVVITLLRRSDMARVLKGSHSFTCTPCVHPLTE